MRILMSMFGWNDSGGGTILPRQIALQLHGLGHEVTVVYAAVPRLPEHPMYTVVSHTEHGVQLYGIHNRPALFFDEKHPDREVNDANIVAIFTRIVDDFQPDLIHYHNFLGLSLGIAEVGVQKGIPAFYTPYNYWLVCPILSLNLPNLGLCQGVNSSGSNCLQCTQSQRPGSDYVERTTQLQINYSKHVGTCLATSQCVAELLHHNGYPKSNVQVLKLGNDKAVKLWEQVGKDRIPAVNKVIHIAYIGSLISLKGAHTLVEAVQSIKEDLKITLYGEGPEEYVTYLKHLDQNNKVHFYGKFSNEELPELLSSVDLGIVPSVCYDHSPLVIGEFLGARIPVLGANIGGIPDYVPPEAGLLFAAGDASDLREKLQGLINAPQRILSMQAQIQAPISFSAYIETLLEMYHTARSSPPDYLRRYQIEQILSQRIKAHCLDSRSLQPSDQAPYGLNITRDQDLKTITASQIKEAQWIRLASSLFAPSLPPEASVIWPLRYAIENSPDLQNPQYVLIAEALHESEKQFIQQFITAYAQTARVSLHIMLRSDDLEDFQSTLLDWFEEESIDIAVIPEVALVEFNSAEDLLSIFEKGIPVITPQSLATCFAAVLTSSALIWLGHDPVPSLFVSTSLTDRCAKDDPLLPYLNMLSPVDTAAEHNQSMITAFEQLTAMTG